MTDFTPNFKSKRPEKFSDKVWLDSNEPQVILYQGMRGSGKGVAVDHTAEKLYREGITVLHIWGARSFENLYWAINKNCREKYHILKEVLKKITTNSYQSLSKDHEKYLNILENEGLISIVNENNTKLVVLEKLGKHEFIKTE